ncbi:MAG: hypothetical protein N3H30_01220 [Candidatus Micrarchaeota archaeon]|nr:hypothetical protein [Candidatus Micrarchaeota archaeon]
MNMPVEYALPLVCAISFLLTYIALPPVIRKLEHKKFVSRDMNKAGEVRVAKFGGVVVLLGFIVAYLLPLQLSPLSISASVLLGTALAISLIALLGLADDLLDIPDIYRVVLPLFAALPIMLLKVGSTVIGLPFIGTINLYFGTLALPLVGAIGLNMYILVLIPIGVIACSNLINLLAGFNGLETGQGIIICVFLVAMLLLGGLNENKVTMLFLLMAMAGALCAFLMFNWYPAKVFPGNVLTYMLGAMVASVAIIGGLEVAGAILLLPQIIEFFLKARSKFQAENFGKCINGRLHYDGPVYSLTHLIMKVFRPTEVQLVLMLYSVQIFSGLLAVAYLAFL